MLLRGPATNIDGEGAGERRRGWREVSQGRAREGPRRFRGGGRRRWRRPSARRRARASARCGWTRDCGADEGATPRSSAGRGRAESIDGQPLGVFFESLRTQGAQRTGCLQTDGNRHAFREGQFASRSAATCSRTVASPRMAKMRLRGSVADSREAIESHGAGGAIIPAPGPAQSSRAGRYRRSAAHRKRSLALTRVSLD